MEKTKKIKIFVGIFYLILVGLFLSFFFLKFSLQDILSYDFIKDNREPFIEISKEEKNKINYILEKLEKL